MTTPIHKDFLSYRVNDEVSADADAAAERWLNHGTPPPRVHS